MEQFHLRTGCPLGLRYRELRTMLRKAFSKTESKGMDVSHFDLEDPGDLFRQGSES